MRKNPELDIVAESPRLAQEAELEALAMSIGRPISPRELQSIKLPAFERWVERVHEDEDAGKQIDAHWQLWRDIRTQLVSELAIADEDALRAMIAGFWGLTSALEEDGPVSAKRAAVAFGQIATVLRAEYARERLDRAGFPPSALAEFDAGLDDFLVHAQTSAVPASVVQYQNEFLAQILADDSGTPGALLQAWIASYPQSHDLLERTLTAAVRRIAASTQGYVGEMRGRQKPRSRIDTMNEREQFLLEAWNELALLTNNSEPQARALAQLAALHSSSSAAFRAFDHVNSV